MAKRTYIMVIAVIVAAFTLATGCQEGNNNIVSEDSGFVNVNLKALNKPVEAIEDFDGEKCLAPPTICGPEVVIQGMVSISQLYSDLGDTPNPSRLPSVLTDHIYIGHLNDAINGSLNVSLVYNSTIDKLFVVFRNVNQRIPVFVYPFTD